jgi:S-DNA-T family DNA segregation ATPase FtsK/SpoIIIE
VERCDECGFSYDDVARDDIPGAIRAMAPRYIEVLGSLDLDVLRAHPLPETWSGLEYACHMRDVLRVQRDRVMLALAEEQPSFASMRREERVTEERYNEQEPAQVAREIREAGESFASTLEAIDDEGWERTGIYNWPVQRVRTVEWIGRHTLHEGEHHMQDIERLAAPG